MTAWLRGLQIYKQEMEANDSFSAEIMWRNGIPQDVVYALRAVSASFRAWGAAAQVTRPLAEGELLRFASRAWRVLYRPGIPLRTPCSSTRRAASFSAETT